MDLEFRIFRLPGFMRAGNPPGQVQRIEGVAGCCRRCPDTVQGVMGGGAKACISEIG